MPTLHNPGINSSQISPLKFVMEELLHNVPGWIWIFIGAIGVIPLVTRGGTLPALIAAAGITICTNVAKNPQRHWPFKILLCTLTVLGSWITIAGVAIATAVIQT